MDFEDDLSLNSSEQSTSSSECSFSSIKFEKCLLGDVVVDIPDEICEQDDLFEYIFSMQSWDNYLSPEQKTHLSKFLPKFDTNDDQVETLRKLFRGENFKFGNPLEQFFSKLRDGYYNVEVAQIARKLKNAEYREYRHKQRKYYYRLLQEILISRKKLLEAAANLPPGVPVKMEQLQPSDKAYAAAKIDDKTKRRYFRELQEVREECEAMETSSDDENYPEGPPPKLKKKQKKQLHMMEQSLSPDIHRITSTMSTVPFLGAVEGTSLSHALQRSPSMIEITDEQYREMLFRHRRHRGSYKHHPALNTTNITVEGIIERNQLIRRNVTKPVVGEASEKKPRPKLKKRSSKSLSFDDSVAPNVHSMSSVPTTMTGCNAGIGDPLGLESNMTIIKTEPDDQQNEVNIMSDGENTTQQNLRSSTPTAEFTVEDYKNFFSLLREKITELNDKRATASQLQECIRQWEESPATSNYCWFVDCGSKKWSELVMSALKFLAGELLGVQPENFIPFIDYKEKLMQWIWVGHDRDSDEEMERFYKFWIKNKDEIVLETSDSLQGLPPPPRNPTNWTVKPTSAEEKEIYQQQELIRYQNPHKAFTFKLHSYESVVGPVKGIYGKEMAASLSNKAREHSLLVTSRPSCVTLLSLVRDAVARLPNGEGTRTDISQLLKDSQFLSDATDNQQLQTVVSGALDRLHYEKDPCVKYDVTRKLWIYLHRNREEPEFEKIHLAQAQAVKAKKSIPKPKLNRSRNRDASVKTANLQNQHVSNDDVNVMANKSKNPQSIGSLPSAVAVGAKIVTPKANKANKNAKTNKETNANVPKMIKQENIIDIKKLATEGSSKLIQYRNVPKSVVPPVSATELMSPTSQSMKLVGQPQLLHTAKTDFLSSLSPTRTVLQPTSIATSCHAITSPTVTGINTTLASTTQTHTILSQVPGISQAGRVQTRATLAARLTSPHLLTVQPALNQTRARPALNTGQRLPQSAVIQTVLSQAARAQLSQAIAAQGQQILIQSPTKTSSSISTTLSRSQFTQALITSGQQMIIHPASTSASKTSLSQSNQQPVLINTTSSVSDQQKIAQTTAMLQTISQSRNKSPVQSTHGVISQMSIGQRPTLVTAVKPGSTQLVQRSISVPDSSNVAQQTVQLLTPPAGIQLAGQRISASQVTFPLGSNQSVKVALTTSSASITHPDLRYGISSSPSTTSSFGSQTMLHRFVTTSSQPQIKSVPVSAANDANDNRQNTISSPFTLTTVQNTPSRPSSTGSTQSLPSPKALVASINAAQMVGELNNPNVECSSPVNVPPVKSEQVVTSNSKTKTSFQTTHTSPLVHQMLTKGNALPLTSENSTAVKTSLSGVTHAVLLKPDMTTLTTSAGHGSSAKPVVAHIISSPQMVTVGNILAQGQKHGNPTAFRIHGSNLVRPNQMLGHQVGVLQSCTGTGVSRLALVSPTNSGAASSVGSTTKLVAVGPGGQLGVVNASQIAALTRGSSSQLHVTSSNKSVILNAQPGLKFVCTTNSNVTDSVASRLSSVTTTNSSSNVSVVTTAQSSTPAITQNTVTLAKTGTQTYVMATLTGSSGMMHPVSVPTGLQGVKVIPVSQQSGKTQVSQQVLARLIAPSLQALQPTVTQSPVVTSASTETRSSADDTSSKNSQ